MLACLVAGLVWYLRSPQFAELVREKVVSAIEDATGGRVELQSCRWKLSQLDFEATGLTVHGLEPSNAPPLAQVATLRVRAHIISLLGRRVDLAYLQVDEPQIHLIVQRDGKTNIPEPRVKGKTGTVQQLFDLAIGRAEVRNGSLQINERRLPLDGSASDISAETSFDRADRRYDGKLTVGKISAKYAEYRELPMSAQAEFSVWQTRAQIKSLRLQSQNSTADVTGTIQNFDNPDAHLDYSVALDLRQAAAIARVTGVRNGTAAVSGSLNYTPAQYSATGKLSIRGADYDAEGAHLRNAGISAEFHADNAVIKLTDFRGRMLGGDVSGNAEIKQAGPQYGQAQLKLAGLSVADVSQALSSRTMPLDKMKLAGGLSGALNLNWKGRPSRAKADFDLDLSAPPQPSSGQLALSGSLRGSHDLGTGVSEFRSLQLATPATSIEASGKISSRSANLNVNASTNNLAEVDDLLNAFSEPALPVQLAGSAAFKGTLNGSLREPSLAGHLQATQLTYLYTPAASAAKASPATRPIHLDSFVGDIAYSPSHAGLHQAVLTTGGITLHLDGSAALDDGTFAPDSNFTLQATMRNGDIASLQQILGTNYPLAGHAELTVQASGTRANPNGHGSFSLTRAALDGRPIDSLSGEVSLQNDNLQLAKLVLKAPGGTVVGSGAYNFGTHQILADLRSDDIQLARVPELQLDRLSTAGVADVTLHASGTLQNPDVDAHIAVEKLVLNQEHVGDLMLDAITHGQQMTLTGRSKFEHAVLALDGNVTMGGNFPGTIDLQFRDLDIDPFLGEEIKGRLTAHSGIAGRAHLSGPLRQPRQLTGTMTVDTFHAEVEKIGVQSDGPIELALANGAVEVKRLAMTSGDTELHVGGSVQLAEARRLNLTANGSVNMALLQSFNPELTSSGKATLDVTLQGTLQRPVINGALQVANVSVSDIDLPAAMSDLDGSLVFNQTRLEIEKLTGHIGGGSVEFGGYLSYANGLSFNFTVGGTDIRFRYSGVSVTANQNLKLQGTPKNATVSGDISITRFAQIPTADIAAAFANASAPVPNANSPLNNLHLDVHVRSAPELTVQTSVAKLAGDVDLRLKGTALNPVLLGRVNVAQGEIKINGQKYFLERADVTFANPVRVDPVLDVEAKTRVRDFDITIGLHGTLERLSTTYRSDPPLSSEDIISLLTLGRTQQEYALSPTTSSAAGLGEATGNAVIGAAINQLVSNRVSKLFGVSAIRINPAVGGGPDNNPNARLTVEQQVSSDVTITYITNLSRSAQQVLALEYNVARDYTINATRDENGVVSFDLLIRKRKK